MVALFGFLKTIGAYYCVTPSSSFFCFLLTGCSFIHRLFCGVDVVRLAEIQTSLSSIGLFLLMMMFDSYYRLYKFEAGWVLEFVVWLWGVVLMVVVVLLAYLAEAAPAAAASLPFQTRMVRWWGCCLLLLLLVVLVAIVSLLIVKVKSLFMMMVLPSSGGPPLLMSLLAVP